jgi:hypothetical protein
MTMGKASTIVAALAALLAMALAPGAQAQRWGHSHSRVVVGFGFPIGWGYWPYWNYPPPYYYYPRAGVPAEPTIYVEKGEGESAPGQDPSQYWYFCRDSNTYFPYVKECPTPWQRVVPYPPSR